MQPVRSSRIWLYSFLYSPTCQKNVFQCVLGYFMLQDRFNWVCSSGPITDSPHDLIEFIKKPEHRNSLILFAQVACSFVLQSWRCSHRAHHLLSTFPFLSEDWGEFLWNTRRDSRPSIERARKGTIARATFVIFHCKYGCSMIQM